MWEISLYIKWFKLENIHVNHNKDDMITNVLSKEKN